MCISFVGPGMVSIWLALIFERDELLLDELLAESILGSELGAYSG